MAFLIDIFINFFSAYSGEENEVIDDIKMISKNYLTGWFTIDIISILPFNDIMSGAGDGSDINSMAKITRIGRMYKLVKLTRLLRILKILKARSKLLKYA